MRVIENVSVDPVAAAGSVWSSVDDMAKWMQFLLDGGRAGGASGKRLLSRGRSSRELFKPQTIAPFDMYPTTRLVKPHWMTYGLGWFQQDYRGRAVDFHTGSIDGMVAIHGLIRDERLGVYVLGNLDHAEAASRAHVHGVRSVRGPADRDWSAEFLKLYGELEREADEARRRREAQRVAGTSPSLPLAATPATIAIRCMATSSHDRRRRASAPLRRRLRRAARALALQHVSREMDGRLAGAGAGHLRARRRWPVRRARDDGHALRPDAGCGKALG